MASKDGEEARVCLFFWHARGVHLGGKSLGVPFPRCHKSQSRGKGWCLLVIQSDLPSPSLTLSKRSRPQKEDTASLSPPSVLEAQGEDKT